MIKEKRKTLRLQEKAEVTLKMIDQDKILECSRIVHDISKNVSPGGIRVDCATMLPVNSKLKIEILLRPSTKPVTAFGQVRWVKCVREDLFATGIEFVDTPEDVIRELQEILGKVVA